MADQNEVDLDSVIDRLLEVRGSRPGKQVQLLEAEIRYLCTKAREIFISQPILLELEAPIKVSMGSACHDQRRLTSPRFAATFTASTTTCLDSLNTAVFRPKQTTSSSATTLIEANNPSRPSASYWHTRSSIQKTSSSCEETTSAPRSIESTASTTSARGDTTSSYGRLLRIASTACPSPQSSTRRSSPCMVV